MAQVVAHSSPFAPQHAPHGIKRSAESSLENEQRLSKRFDLLNLVDNNGTRLYIPVPGSTDAHSPRRADAVPTAHPLAATLPLTKRARTPRSPRASDTMDVEDTPHRVYIHDLAAELSDIESDEENPIFLPDIEKHLSKIPKHVLLGPEPKSNEHNQMVLYNVPASLTVPEERDGVRKAIVEARQRIRNGQANPVMEVERVASPVSRMDTNMNIPLGDDVEAMDID
ncbi:hypothetical protein HBH53_105740 [Parastagonospora nodorum]|nr:hypothetical protein HBH53_105740 [Parastagonospora nodorum]KAH5765275.1 hypothetical protein HBI16_161390 [Parastagonospora nodorum]KAH5995986.1 hypothetical protein HBI84_128000 [Parastagonospora nodorum]